MMRTISAISRADAEALVSKLRALYLSARATPLGRPRLRLGGTVLEGPPIDRCRVRYLEPLPSRATFAAVDASIRALLDLGSCIVVAAKVAAAAWRRGARVYSPDPRVRVTAVGGRREAGDWLARVELEEALRLLRRLRGGDYLLLDRGLVAHPRVSEATRSLALRVVGEALEAGVRVVGVPKRCSAKLSGGASAVGVIARLASERFPEMPWYYYPLFSRGGPLLGDVAVAKFSEECDAAFRVDLAIGDDCDVGVALGEVAYVQDSCLPGYPHPLKAVHEEARMSEHEVECLRGAVLELLEAEGVLDELAGGLSLLSFKERYLWG